MKYEARLPILLGAMSVMLFELASYRTRSCVSFFLSQKYRDDTYSLTRKGFSKDIIITFIIIANMIIISSIKSSCSPICHLGPTLYKLDPKRIISS